VAEAVAAGRSVAEAVAEVATPPYRPLWTDMTSFTS